MGWSADYCFGFAAWFCQEPFLYERPTYDVRCKKSDGRCIVFF